MNSELVIPSEIPWNEIKGSNLEELLYWLFDSMGAKDLEWRIGGKGGGAADQGRDLELSFFVLSPDGTFTKQIWWVETKGRTGTVKPYEVHQAVLNAAGKTNIDVFVVATNTNFSNPTRDWVKEWQCDHPRPSIRLWERTELENLCSKNPLAVIRLHSKALTPQGKVKVASSKLWDYATFTGERTLESIWKERESITLDERCLFALVASELANGDIGVRSWALIVSNEILAATLHNGLINFLYLAFRANDMGVRQEPIIRAISYLIVVATQRIELSLISWILSDVEAWDDVESKEYREKVREITLKPILWTLQGELEEVCASDCPRVSTGRKLLQDVEIESYWDRLKPCKDTTKKARQSSLIIESLKEPCKVGFAVGEKVGCPLCHTDEPDSDIGEFISVIDQVIRFRISEKT